MKHFLLAAALLVGGCMGSAAERAAESRHEGRPGLATAWGEDLYAPIRHVPFERCSAEPSLVAIRYDDHDGVQAWLQRDGEGAVPVPHAWLGTELRVALVGESGRPLEMFRSPGSWLAAGAAGERYEIEVVNDGTRRWEVVASVDGLDVIDGRPASVHKRGYLLEPGGTLRIAGFRRSGEQVAAFRLGSVESSYAALTGHGEDAGVIGLALFCEGGRAAEVDRRAGATPFPADR